MQGVLNVGKVCISKKITGLTFSANYQTCYICSEFFSIASFLTTDRFPRPDARFFAHGEFLMSGGKTMYRRYRRDGGNLAGRKASKHLVCPVTASE